MPPPHCEICGGGDNHRAVEEMLAAMRDAGAAKQLVVGGSPGTRRRSGETLQRADRTTVCHRGEQCAPERRDRPSPVVRRRRDLGVDGDSAQSDGGDPGVGGPDGWAARRGGAGACGGGMVRRWSQHHAAPRGSCAWSPSAANHARLAGNASPDARKWGPPGAFPAAARDADSRRKGRDSGRVAASAGRDRKSAFALVRKRDRDGGNRQRRAEVDRTRHLGREATRQDG